MNKKSVIHGLITLLLLAIIGYLLNNQRYLNSRLFSLVSPPGIIRPFISPTITYQNPQTFEILKWKEYYNQNLGISFEYPDNLGHEFPPGTNPSALKEDKNGVYVMSGMSYIFSVGKINTNDDVETYWKKSNVENNIGNGLMQTTMTKTNFRNKLAYYFRNTETQQVPSDYYLIPMNGYILMITFEKHTTLGQVIDSSCPNGVCNTNSLYLDKDYEESFLRFNYQIISRILSSIEFIR